MVRMITCSVVRTFQQVFNRLDLKELLLQPRHSSSGGLLKHRCICADPRWSWQSPRMIPCTWSSPWPGPTLPFFLLPVSSPAYQAGPKQPATCIKPRSRRELLRTDNNTKWIFPNREKQLSLLFECFTFPRSINWLFDHRQRCAVTDKEQVISKVAWRTERQPAVAACWRWDKGMVM